MIELAKCVYFGPARRCHDGGEGGAGGTGGGTSGGPRRVGGVDACFREHSPDPSADGRSGDTIMRLDGTDE